METLASDEIERAVKAALEEDIGSGDATTSATIPKQATATGLIVARESLILAGAAFAKAVFTQVSSAVRVEQLVTDGEQAAQGQTLLRMSGSAAAILTGERVALNFLQRLSGIATVTAQFVRAVQGTKSKILDTRKTTPGWRRFEKYAVRCGGGTNHRFGLSDMVMIKDNHLVVLQGEQPNPIAVAVSRARAQFPRLKVEVEADSLEQASQAVAAGADFILLDNMSLEELREGVRLAAGKAQTEASGGVNLNTVRAIAETGVDFISVGALTHSARAVDIGMDFEVD